MCVFQEAEPASTAEASSLLSFSVESSARATATAIVSTLMEPDALASLLDTLGSAAVLSTAVVQRVPGTRPMQQRLPVEYS